MEVRIPSPLRSYTGGASSVEGRGASIKEVLSNLDIQYPGIRFRMIDEQDCIRPHIKLFVNNEAVQGINLPIAQGDKLHIIAALSGG